MLEIKVPVTLYYTYKKYDYTGKFIEKVENKSLSLPSVVKQDEPEENKLGEALLNMKVS